MGSRVRGNDGAGREWLGKPGMTGCGAGAAIWCMKPPIAPMLCSVSPGCLIDIHAEQHVKQRPMQSCIHMACRLLLLG